jgi:polysaccharide export outer membrane protein
MVGTVRSVAVSVGCVVALLLPTAWPVHAQAQTAAVSPRPGAAAPPVVAGAIVPPAGYVIGPDDVLSVLFWRDKDMSADVAVRPDGKITLPLLNDVDAAGLTPDQLRDKVTAAAARYVDDPSVTVVVKAINSRKVFITGQVPKPGAYSLTGPTTVMQLIAMAGGVAEYSDSENIQILRNDNGKQTALRFNYKDVAKRRKNLAQNIELKPGDTIVVP